VYIWVVCIYGYTDTDTDTDSLMYVCMYAWNVPTHIIVCVCVCVCVRGYIDIQIHNFPRVYVRTRMCMRVFLCICIFLRSKVLHNEIFSCTPRMSMSHVAHINEPSDEIFSVARFSYT